MDKGVHDVRLEFSHIGGIRSGGETNLILLLKIPVRFNAV